MEELSRELRDRTLEKLGLPGPPPLTLEGLNRLYGAWCARVPFDNVRKRIALIDRDSGPLPGGEAPDFFAAWLRHGTGGTCWPSSNGLYAIVAACGFDARRATGSMMDQGDVNHGSVFVRVDGIDFMVDSSMLTGRVFPVIRGRKTELPDPVLPVIVEPDGNLWVIRFARPVRGDPLVCRILDDCVDLAFYLDRYEWSRENSIFNEHLFARTNRGDSMLSIIGTTRFVTDAEKTTPTELGASAIGESLRREFRLSEEIVHELATRNALG